MKKIISLLLSLFILFCTACGGGTIGTDESLRRNFSGVITNIDGVVIANVKVTDLNVGTETESDSNGEFNLKSVKVRGDVRLLISYLENEQEIIIPNLTEEDAEISLEIQIDIISENISLISFSIKERESEESLEDSSEVGQDEEIQNEEIDEIKEDISFSKSLINGKLKLDNGSPVTGATISAVGYRVKAKTAERGGFNFEIPVGAKSLTFKIIYEGQEETVIIRNLPNYAFVLDIELKIILEPVFNSDEVTQTASEISVNIVKDKFSERN